MSNPCMKPLDDIEDFFRRKITTIDIPIDRLEQLCQAEREGRAVILPCKVGDMVYTIKQELLIEWHIHHIQIQINGRTNTPHIRLWAICDNAEDDDMDFWDEDFGKTVFLTREAAVKALQALGGGVD